MSKDSKPATWYHRCGAILPELGKYERLAFFIPKYPSGYLLCPGCGRILFTSDLGKLITNYPPTVVINIATEEAIWKEFETNPNNTVAYLAEMFKVTPNQVSRVLDSRFTNKI